MSVRDPRSQRMADLMGEQVLRFCFSPTAVADPKPLSKAAWRSYKALWV